MEKQSIRMKILREKNLKNMLNNLFFKPIIVSIDDMDRFWKKELKKTRPINIPEPITKSVGGFKDKIGSLFNTNTHKQTVYGTGKKLRKPRNQNSKKPFITEENKEKIKDRIIRDIWNPFEIEDKKKKERNQRKRKSKMKD